MGKKDFYIKTLGCKVNQYESQVIRENLLRSGYTEAEDLDEASISIVNTCTVTSRSDSKSIRLIRNSVKRGKCVIATGCMVEDRDLDISELGGPEFIIRNKDKYRIPEILSGHECITGKSWIKGLKGHTRVFVKTQDGCDNVCSYCKVRIVRGRSKSRPFKDVLDECRSLIGNGSKEIVLTGICLGAYGRDLSRDINLCKLIRELCKIDGHWRLRLSSIEPKDINRDLIKELHLQPRLCKHLHIPFQSGDDYILKRMKRPYKRSDYLDIVYRLKGAIPDIAISSDIMVGFPGETEKRFCNTLDFIKLVRPMRMHIFPFSRRRGTEAYTYRDDVKEAVKRQREDVLWDLAGDLSMEFAMRFTDKTVELLVEDKEAKDGHLQGYTDRYIKLHIKGPDSLKGQLVNSS